MTTLKATLYQPPLLTLTPHLPYINAVTQPVAAGGVNDNVIYFDIKLNEAMQV